MPKGSKSAQARSRGPAPPSAPSAQARSRGPAPPSAPSAPSQGEASVLSDLPSFNRNDCTDVFITNADEKVIAVLDVDQSKHQPANYPIGSRVTQKGTTFSGIKGVGSADWHKENTLPVMLEWAQSQNITLEGSDGRKFTGQTKTRDLPKGGKFHAEGYCIMFHGKKFVIFHCYPD